VTPLVAIRHAPTAWNRARRLQGRTDIPLDEAGEAVARSWAVPDEWRGYHVLSSPLQRARRTAQILFPDREIAIDARLIEIGFGDWEGEVLAELRARPGGDARARESLGLDFSAPGGETPRDVQARLRPLLVEIDAARRPTLIVAHKAVIRALLSLATGWQMLDKPPVKLAEGTAQVFAVGSGGAIRIDRPNVRLMPKPRPEFACSLRQRSTDAERKLWMALRDRRLQGVKFSRQVPVGSYVVDFLCRASKLVIELDGGQHDLCSAADERRTKWLEMQGYRVIRFWNNDVLGNLPGVLERIVENLPASTPMIRKSPRSTGKEEP
jgi:probable phosphoglycerate mutase